MIRDPVTLEQIKADLDVLVERLMDKNNTREELAGKFLRQRNILIQACRAAQGVFLQIRDRPGSR